MEYLKIQEAINKGEGSVAIRGWCYRVRGSNKVIFIVVRDSSNIIQCVVDDSCESWGEAQKVTIESSLQLEGTIKKEPRAPSGFEINVLKLKLVGGCDSFPITKDQSPEFLLDKRHLWLRSRKLTAIMKIRHTIIGAIHKYFRDRGYFEFDPPIFTPNACEGGSTLFEVKYYSDKVYLTQSWQLYAEAAIFSLEKIYDVAPTFRAEKSKTSRHLSEFWMAEMEAAWMDLAEVSQVAKDEIKFIIEEVLKNNNAELDFLKRDISKLEPCIKENYPTITYTDALNILKEKENVDIEWGKDLRTIEEDLIMKHFKTPIVVTHYPKEIMAFYKPADPKNTKVALCFDMLAPEGYGEIVGGSQRCTDIEELIEGLRKEGEKPENYDWYLDLRRYGTVPHAGYGMGVERVVAWICGLDNIKDAIAFPRTMLRKSP